MKLAPDAMPIAPDLPATAHGSWGFRVRAFVRCLGVALLAYGLAMQIGLWLRVPSAPIALFWPAAGVGTALVILGVRRSRLGAVLTGIVLANVLMNLLAGNDALLTLGFATANTVEVGTAGLIFTRLRRSYTNPIHAMPSLLAAAVAAVVTSTGVALALVRPTIGGPVWAVAVDWAVPDVAGIMVMGSLILAPHRISARRLPEGALQLSATLGVGGAVSWLATGLPVSWMMLPGLVWAAMRLGTSWTAASSALIAFLSSYSTARGHGPFGGADEHSIHLLAGQAFSAVAVFTAMTLAGVVAERERVAAALAMRDPLTGLGNRLMLSEQAGPALGGAHRPGSVVALFYCDLNGFKTVNDTYGHAVGDGVLRSAAHELAAAARSQDLVVRVGGDEFVVLCTDLEDRESADRVGRRLRRLACQIETPGGTISCRFAVGQAVTDRPTTLAELIARADRAMYVDKAAARTVPQQATVPGRSAPATGRR